MRSKYGIFLKRILILLTILFFIDQAAGWILGFFFPKMKVGETSRITYAINNSKEDLVIFGSSKANHHYVPSVFEQELQLNSYNAGIDGQSILYDYGVLKCILARHIPKVVILDLHIDEFNKSEKSYTVLSALLPYYNEHEIIRKIVNLRGPYEKYKAMSNLYRYNSLAFTIAINSVLIKKDTTKNGYYPLYNTLIKPLQEEVVDKNVAIDTVKINFFKSFIDDAKAAGVKVYVFVSPVYRLRDEMSETVKIAEKICEERNILLKNYSQYSIFLKHPEYFQDESHLNNNGATLYSKMVSENIVTDFKEGNLTFGYSKMN